MVNRPLFSIILPIYNSGKYLRSLVDSTVSRCYDNCELILIDDGSPAICDEYAASHANTAGKYILFVDSDAGIADGSLKSLSDFLAKNGEADEGFPNTLMC